MDRKYVLLAEDNPADIVLTQRVFEKCRIPHELKVVRDGQEALDFLFGRGSFAGRDLNQNPSLILLDLKLPYLNGLEVLEQIKANKTTNAIPVVVLTSSDDQKDHRESARLGANSFLRKPVSYEEFRNLIQELVSFWCKC